MTDSSAEFEDLTEKEVAGLRWKAIEAAIAVPKISPMARRVLIAMICAMDNRTRECFPSELWLAAQLSADIRSIKAAKVELRNATLIMWTNPNGPRHRSLYKFNWAKLERLRDAARQSASAAVNSRRAFNQRQRTSLGRSFNGGETTTLGQSIGDEATTNETFPDPSKVVVSSSQGGDFITPGWSSHHSKVVASPPEQPCTNSVAITAQHHAPRGDEKPGSVISRPRALEESVADRPRQPGAPIRSHFPALAEAFADDAATLRALDRIAADQEAKAAKALAMKGPAAAKAIILAGIEGLPVSSAILPERAVA